MTTDLLTEIARAGPEHLDAAYVAAYDQKAGFDPGPDLEALSARGLGEDSTLIDFGAGTGTLAVDAASICKRVIAVDVSPAMVDAIRPKADEASAQNVECVQAGFLSYEHQGEAPDFIYAECTPPLARLLEGHRPQQDRSAPRTRRNASTPRSRVLLRPFGCEGRRRALASILGGGSPRGRLDTPMLRRAGFKIESGDYGSVGVYASYICVKSG